MELIILGTSSTKPTRKRNHSAYFLTYKNEGILFDCGEGTQRQMMQAGIKPNKITKIFISHWHGDHMLGLPGLLQTMAVNEYTKSLKIYGPPGSKNKYKKMLDAFESSYKIEAKIHDIKEGKVLETDDYYIEAYSLTHRTKCYGYRFVEKDKRQINMSKLKKLGVTEGPIVGKIQEGKTITVKGKKIKPEQVSKLVKGRIFAYVADTRPCKNCEKLARNADLLLCESTYSSEHADKAREYKHLTAQEAAQIAANANVKKLILTHYSARYKNEHELEQDARTVFDNSFGAKDFAKFKILKS
ncbi:ribonuclease Z [Candidatus Woesearchaeota archaeon]|nr:ribonuclease Z [Candidatus Woesearchaeota archaeon]